MAPDLIDLTGIIECLLARKSALVKALPGRSKFSRSSESTYARTAAPLHAAPSRNLTPSPTSATVRLGISMRAARSKREEDHVKGKRPRRRAKRPLRLRALVGMFASGAGDLGRRHDDYLYGWKKPDA